MYSTTTKKLLSGKLVDNTALLSDLKSVRQSAESIHRNSIELGDVLSTFLGGYRMKINSDNYTLEDDEIVVAQQSTEPITDEDKTEHGKTANQNVNRRMSTAAKSLKHTLPLTTTVTKPVLYKKKPQTKPTQSPQMSSKKNNPKKNTPPKVTKENCAGDLKTSLKFRRKTNRTKIPRTRKKLKLKKEKTSAAAGRDLQKTSETPLKKSETDLLTMLADIGRKQFVLDF